MEQTLVFFKRPNEGQLYQFLPGSGSAVFHVMPFDPEQHEHQIKGQIIACEWSDAEQQIDALILPVNSGNSTHTESDYVNMVELAKQAIKQAQFDKVVLSTRSLINTTTPLSSAFKQLLSQTAAFVYLISYQGKVMIGASPELLMSLHGDVLQTMALGGTSMDNVFTHKETLEHEQITGYIDALLLQSNYTFEKSDSHSVKAGKLFHLQTQYIIQSQGLVKDQLMAKQLHPTSAVCGWPYAPAMAFINQYEQYNRAWYAGFLGISSDVGFEYYVNLRCADVYKGQLMLYAGAGINSYSDPKAEWQEIQNKMKTVLDCF